MTIMVALVTKAGMEFTDEQRRLLNEQYPERVNYYESVLDSNPSDAAKDAVEADLRELLRSIERDESKPGHRA
ncbi:hypothetical protein AB0D40_04245 [Streptomyces massasporeus]|uniref:hypothetical protein n=1 Tax=Streptomyces massasporeus TaxID=67324 RepID=UPI0033F314A9